MGRLTSDPEEREFSASRARVHSTVCRWVGTDPLKPSCISGHECLGEAGLEMPKHCNGILVPGFPRVNVSYGIFVCLCICAHVNLCI